MSEESINTDHKKKKKNRLLRKQKSTSDRWSWY